MAWVKIDDHFDEHPKMAAAGPLGMAMQIAALCYCNRHLTDGMVPTTVARRLIDLDGMSLSWSQVADALVASGVWERCDGGYLVHDYLKFQPSREEVLAERESARNRMAEVRAGKGKGNKQGRSPEVRLNKSKGSASPVPVPGPVPVPEEHRDIPTSYPTGTSSGESPAALAVAEGSATVEQADPRSLAVECYDALKSAGKVPDDQGWVGRAIGRIKKLTPAARIIVADVVSWASLDGQPGYLGAWITECDFPQLLRAYRDRNAQPRASPANQERTAGIVHALQAAGRLPRTQSLEVVADDAR